MSLTGIAWTDRTINFATGCTQVSPGCDHCYAKTLVDRRLSNNPTSVRFGHPFEEVMMHPERFNTVRMWKKPQRVFVNSMSDLFHKEITDEFIGRAIMTMAIADRHTFQVLTKRPDRMRHLIPKLEITEMTRCPACQNSLGADIHRPGHIYSCSYFGGRQLFASPLPNVWLGVSIESNDYAWRADMLRETPAAVRFLSIEPMLGPVDAVDFTGVDWIIAGGESGKGARPLDLGWLRDVRDRCAAASIPFFLKQLGGATKKRDHEEALLDGLRHVAWPA